MMIGAKQKINIQVVSDVMCPWCWVGKRKLEAAMKDVQDKYDFQVTWHPFLLRPSMPREGVPKLPDAPQNTKVANLKVVGKDVGIEFTGKADRYPNTLQAHALLEYTGNMHGPVKQNEVAEALFKAYFTEGLQPNTDRLVSIAKTHDMNPEQVRKFVTKEENLQKVYNTAINWGNKGVTGVPSFFMNGGPTFSGAQEVEVFTRIFDIVAQKRPLERQPSQL